MHLDSHIGEDARDRSRRGGACLFSHIVLHGFYNCIISPNGRERKQGRDRERERERERERARENNCRGQDVENQFYDNIDNMT